MWDARAWLRRNGGLLLVQWPCIVREASVTSAARCARASEAHVLDLVSRESVRSGNGAQARYMHKSPRAVRGRAGIWDARAWLRRNGGLLLVQCPSIVHGPSAAGLARRARASKVHVLGLVPRASAVARKRATRASHLAQ